MDILLFYIIICRFYKIPNLLYNKNKIKEVDFLILIHWNKSMKIREINVENVWQK